MQTPQQFRRWRTDRFRRIAIGTICLVLTFAISIELIPAFFLNIPDRPLDRPHYDAIIGLGYPALADGKPSPMLAQRVNAAIALDRQQRADRLIFTGGAAHNRSIEAQVMADLARSQGVPDTSIILEPQARNTCQNALYSVGMMQQHDWHSAIVVSSPNHLPRANYLFSRYPIEFAMASSGYPATMNALERWLFEKYERYALTRIVFSGYPRC